MSQAEELPQRSRWEAYRLCTQEGNGKKMATGLKISFWLLVITMIPVAIGPISLPAHLTRAFLVLALTFIGMFVFTIITMLKQFR